MRVGFLETTELEAEVAAAIAFGRQHAFSPKERLISILNNIIENNGDFVPTNTPLAPNYN